MRVFRTTLIATGAAIVLTAAAVATANANPTCPLSYGATDAAKSHTLFLYFPLADDATFPNYDTGVSPAKHFDVAQLTPLASTTVTTSQLRDRIFDVVSDDYCEFNVQVKQTTTSPALMGSPPARRSTIAIGSDVSGAWGEAQEVDIGDAVNIDFARVWGGTYTTCEGSNGMGGCTTGSLTGAAATLDHWALAIGGTAAHEAGHTYGLAHTDDDPSPDPADPAEAGFGPAPGEDGFARHIMPAGANLTGNDRSTYRRHFSDRTFGILAQNVGLSIQTMHNWNLTNPNGVDGHSLTIDFLSQLPAVTLAWSYTGQYSPWINPTVSGPIGGPVTWQGTPYNHFRITWSTPNTGSTIGPPGVVPAGAATFHIGATFTGVDFDQPDPIVIQNVTLFDAGSAPLVLHPRLVAYDAGTADTHDGTFSVNFFANGGAPLILQDIQIQQLPRVASIQSMIGAGRPMTFDKQPIRPWSVQKCATNVVRERMRCTIAKLGERHHVVQTFRVGERGVYDCRNGVPKVRRAKDPISNSQDSRGKPDYEGPICAGVSTDPFPSTTIYVTATVIDPKAKHWDPRSKQYIVGPVSSKLYYQFAGFRNHRDQKTGRTLKT